MNWEELTLELDRPGKPRKQKKPREARIARVAHKGPINKKDRFYQGVYTVPKLHLDRTNLKTGAERVWEQMNRDCK